MTAGNYTSINSMKVEIDINDTVDDEVLKLFATRGNRYVDDILYVHAATLPLTGDQLTSAQGIALWHALMHWYRRQKDWEAYRSAKESRDEDAQALIAKLAAQPGTNTQSQSYAYSQPYRSEPIKTRTGL